MSLMFDGSGNLNCDASLPTAQALCILMVYNLVGDGAPVNMGHRGMPLIQALVIVNHLCNFRSGPADCTDVRRA
jgi:hypothetical protein